MEKVFLTGASGFIGTGIVSKLEAAGYQIANFDLKRPTIAAHEKYWMEGDVLDPETVSAALENFAPDHVIHLAARTDTSSEVLQDYRVNTAGSSNVIDACARLETLQRFVLTSSQFVFGPYGLPTNDEDFRPHTVYGKSKQISEEHLRSSDLKACWTIVRPTNIWGPWHPRYADEFWSVLRRGLYIHPKGPDVYRSYGYVGTVADQVLAILKAPVKLVDHQVFYLGDPPMRLLDWVDGFSIAISGRPVRKVPQSCLRAVAFAGDCFEAATGRRAPLTSSRFRSMTQSYLTPMEKTFAILGQPRRTLQEGIDETVSWLRQVRPEYRI
jgi:GlcNAc-P-P-Und epimerase